MTPSAPSARAARPQRHLSMCELAGTAGVTGQRSVGPKCVGRALNTGQMVRPPLGVAHVAMVWACSPVDRLAHDVGMPGVLSSVGQHSDQQGTEGGVTPLLRPP